MVEVSAAQFEQPLLLLFSNLLHEILFSGCGCRGADVSTFTCFRSDTTDRDRPGIKNTLMMICTITLGKKNNGKRKNSEDLLENSCKVESQMKNLQKKT